MRKAQRSTSTGYAILLVDDNQEYLEATRILLDREGHEVLCAGDGPAALDLLRNRRFDLVLLDYYMPGMTGEEVVAELRQADPYIQVVLQTGYASEQPPRELLRRLDIQGYHDKNEGPEKLLMWTDAALKAARTLRLLNSNRLGLRRILDSAPVLHKIQPMDELLRGVLDRFEALAGAENSFLATTEEDAELIVRAGTGRFSERAGHAQSADAIEAVLMADALRLGRSEIGHDGTVVPLRVGETTIGAVFLDRALTPRDDMELFQVFANQAAVAIQNAQLYALATLDSLTGTFARGFFDRWFLRELRSSFRSKDPLSLLMVDLNAMKRINDSAGHLAGDQALTTVGKALQHATRSTDVVGRYGGDEFALVLPQSESEGAEIVARRILGFLEGRSVPSPGGSLPLSVSIGLSTLKAPGQASNSAPRAIPQGYFRRMGQELIRRADDALYKAKKDEKDRLRHGEPTEWLPPDLADLD